MIKKNRSIIAIKICFAVFTLCLLMSCGNKGYKQQRLKNASSPYLREQAESPVDWYEWSDEALDKAKKENKPLLVSIGYSSCHWCHVMKEETFMDTAVARIMNENFICIKVDREERPDIDNVYANAVQLLTGSSGWPLNAFALPDGKPFFAGTYYPKKSWVNLITEVAKAYKDKQDLVLKQADALAKGIANQDFLLPYTLDSSAAQTTAFYSSLYDSVYSHLDVQHGGLKGAPKFPTPALGEFLLQHYYTNKNEASLKAANTLLRSMALGGIYDQVEGGFARYTIDSAWKVPHFEKMLYDNGQLISLYAHAYQLTQNEWYKKVLMETISFVEQNLSAKNGGYYSSTNADSETQEGKFYTWSERDFLNAVGGNKTIADYFNISASGNWKPNENILFASKTPVEFASANKLNRDSFSARLVLEKANLLKERNKRKKPSVDEKIITSWNCILIKGYVDAYTATGIERYLEKAKQCALFIEKNMLSTDGSLHRIYINQKKSINGFLDDYAWTVSAFMKLYEVTFNKQWALKAKKITGYALTHFNNKNAPLLYYSNAQFLNGISRKMEIADDYLPSSNAVMAKAIYSLGLLFDDTTYTNKSVQMLAATKLRTARLPAYHLQWCMLWGLQANKTFEVMVMGKDALAKKSELQKNYLPTSFFMGSINEEPFPLLKNKLVEGRTFIYVCTNKACKRPEEQVANALKQLQ